MTLKRERRLPHFGEGKIVLDNLTNERRIDRCPNCGTQRLRRWSELDEEEREVVRRLPASADFSFKERVARRLWCVRCWHEETSSAQIEA